MMPGPAQVKGDFGQRLDTRNVQWKQAVERVRTGPPCHSSHRLAKARRLGGNGALQGLGQRHDRAGANTHDRNAPTPH